MNVNVMVNDYPCTRLRTIRKSLRKSVLEVDCELDEPNTFEDDPQDTFEQGKWILPLHILFVPN
jgi:hypothetical protein